MNNGRGVAKLVLTREIYCKLWYKDYVLLGRAQGGGAASTELDDGTLMVLKLRQIKTN